MNRGTFQMSVCGRFGGRAGGYYIFEKGDEKITVTNITYFDNYLKKYSYEMKMVKMTNLKFQRIYHMLNE